MMKRVGFSRFKLPESERNSQQCLRFEGVDANGDLSDDENSAEVQTKCDCKQVNSEVKCYSDCMSKSNLLNAIKHKWKRNTRNKCCDSRSKIDPLLNVRQYQSENHEVRTFSKHYRTRNHKSGSANNVCSTAMRILKCQNHQQPQKKSAEAAKLVSSMNEENESCTCISSALKYSENKSNAACAKLKTCTSCSLSDITCNTSSLNASLRIKSDSESNVCNAHSSISDPVDTHASKVCSMQCNEVHPGNTSLQDTPRVGNLTQELYKLSKYGWYWGPINRNEAELKLVDQPDGAFLVRDSSDDRYILSLSFRSYGKTLHTRIEHSNGLFSFYSQPEPEGHASIVELIQQSMCYSQSGVFCYSRSRSPGSPSYPVRLTKPISRFNQVRSLQYLCRFIIRQYIRYDHIQKLPLPSRIKGYLEEAHY